MDLAVEYIGRTLINPFIPSEYHTPHFWPSQFLSCWILNYIGGFLFYFSFATLSYWYFFRHNKSKYYPTTLPEDITHQIQTEISIAMKSFPLMALCFSPFTFGVTRSWSKMYYSISDYGWGYLIFSVILFLFITDFMIYYIHRGLHIGWFYNNIHKQHHTYQYTTPFSSHAFHWGDGWAQGVPYYIFVYIFPFHWLLWICMFFFVNCWTVLIHDQVDFLGHSFIQSTGHHTIHHTSFKYNYGQYFTFWDKFNGTYHPTSRTHTFSGSRLTQKKI